MKYTPTDPLGQFMAAGRPNLVLGHQMPASNDLGQPSYTTVEERESRKIKKRKEKQEKYYEHVIPMQVVLNSFKTTCIGIT